MQNMTARARRIAARQKRKAGVTGDRSSVGLFIRLPKALAEQYPSLKPEDDSPAHVTFFYGGDVPAKRQAEWLEIVGRVLGEVRGPVRAVVDGVDYFQHPHTDPPRTVAFTPLRFSHDMAAIMWNVRDQLMDAGFEAKQYSPLVYRPHTTLGYLDGLGATWDGDVPRGDWMIEGIEVWGLPQMVVIPLGAAEGRNTDLLAEGPPRTAMAERLAKRFLEAAHAPLA